MLNNTLDCFFMQETQMISLKTPFLMSIRQLELLAAIQTAPVSWQPVVLVKAAKENVQLSAPSFVHQECVQATERIVATTLLSRQLSRQGAYVLHACLQAHLNNAIHDVLWSYTRSAVSIPYVTRKSHRNVLLWVSSQVMIPWRTMVICCHSRQDLPPSC